MALTIGELVGFIRTDDTGMRRGLTDAELRMRGFQRDTEGRLRTLDGRFASFGERMSLNLREGTDEGDRFRFSLGRIAGMAGRLGGVAASVGRIVAMLGAAVPVAAGLVATLANIVPAGGVAVTAMLALQQATFAVKLGTQGMDKALAAALDPDKAKDFEKALEKLSPEARQFARAVRDLSPEFRKLQQSVQDELFRGLAENLKQTAKVVLPVLRKELFNTSLALGDMAAGVMGAARDLAANGTLGKAMASASMGLRNLSGLPGIVVTALGQIAAAAGPSFEGLTAAAAHGANKIGERLSKAFESGKMQDAIQDAIDLIGDLVDVAMNVGRIVGSIFKAAQVSGGGFVGTLKDITGALADAFASPQVQGGLKALFTTMSTLAATVAPLLGQALGMIAPIVEQLAPPVQNLIRVLGDQLTNTVLPQLGPVLEQLAFTFGTLVETVTPLIPVFAQMVADLLPSLIPLLMSLSDLIIALSPFIQGFAVGLSALLVPAIQMVIFWVNNFVIGLTGLIGWVQTTVDRITDFSNTTLRGLLGEAIGFVVALFRGDFSRAWALANSIVAGSASAILRILDYLTGGAVTRIRNLGSQVVSLARAQWGQFVQAIRDAGGRARTAVTQLKNATIGSLSNVGSLLYNAGRNLISGFINGIKSQFSSVRSTLASLTNSLTSWKGPEDVDKRILIPAGRMVIAGFQRGIADQTPALRAQLQGLTGEVPGMALGGLGSAPAAAAGGMSGVLRIELAGPEEVTRLIRGVVMTKGGGNVQLAFGRR